MKTPDIPLAASVVPDNRRMSILPKYLGIRHMLSGEDLIYRWMRNLWPGYSGGLWTMVEVSNGTFYMRLDNPQGVVDLRGPNGNEERRMSLDAAGLTATLYAFNALACYSEDDTAIEQYRRLLDYARTHPESVAIRRLID